MAKLDVFHRYMHIVHLLMKHPCTLEQINDYLQLKSEQDGMAYATSGRTFLRDKDAILSLFKMEIMYDSGNKKYYIQEDEHTENLHLRLLEAFSTFHALQYTDDLPNAIEFEQRLPQGMEYFRIILQAIQQSKELVFEYQKFYKEQSEQRNVQPLLLKEHRNRWYLLAKDIRENDIRIFGLERMEHVILSTKRFKKDPHIDTKKYFEDAYGIIKPAEEKPQEIILSFDTFMGKYIKTMPLHHSQQIIAENEQELRITLKVYLTEDLIMELLSHGHHVKILHPQALVQKLKNSLEKNLQQYANIE